MAKEKIGGCPKCWKTDRGHVVCTVVSTNFHGARNVLAVKDGTGQCNKCGEFYEVDLVHLDRPAKYRFAPRANVKFTKVTDLKN